MLPDHWPRWTIILVSLALTLFTIVIGLVLEPATQAIAPQLESTPTLISLSYATPLSGECVNCHTDKERLQGSIASEDKLEQVFIEPSDILSVHGRLGCVTCHRGTEGTEDADTAHIGLIIDPALHLCLLCHRNMPDEFPEDRLRTPHGKMVHSPMEDVTCSDCHGGIGHGFDPVSGEVICPMSVCLNCHEERNLDTQLKDCIVCHIGPHDVDLTLNCSYCHTSTETWSEYHIVEHPVELVGRHAEAWCFRCHEWPNFRGLNYACSDCHKPATEPHFGEVCEDCHTPTSFKDANLPPQLHPVPLVGAHQRANCDVCHTEGQQVPEYVCTNCHRSPENHLEGTCDTCHTPEGWSESAASPMAQSSQITHTLDGMTDCCGTIRLGRSNPHRTTMRTLSTNSALSATNSRRNCTHERPRAWFLTETRLFFQTTSIKYQVLSGAQGSPTP